MARNEVPKVNIVGKNGTKAEVTGQNELKVTLTEGGEPISSSNPLAVEVVSGGGGSSDINISQVGGAPFALGQSTKAGSISTTIASDQGNLPISATSLPLPTGAATSALQGTGNTSLATIATNTTGVATAANQSTANSSLATIATNTGNAATSANQTTANNSLATIATNTTGLNAAIKAEDSPSASGDSLVSIGGIRFDSDTSPVSADGDYHSFLFNQTGRLKVSVKAAATAGTTGTITTSTSIVALECSRESTATLNYSGTFTGLNTTFEYSPNSTNGADGDWYLLQGIRTNADQRESISGVVATGLAYGWMFYLPPGTTYVRTRATAFTSGSATVTWKPGVFAADPLARVSTLAAGTAAIGSVTVTAITPGAGASNLGKQEDSPHTTADVGLFMLGVRQDSQVISTSANGDYNLMAVDQYGNNLVRSYGTIRKTYSSSFTFTPAATATDSIEIIGAASTSIQITKIIIGGIATAASALAASLIRRSTLDSGGTSTNQTIAKHEVTDANSAITIKLYSANPTVGTTAGTLRTFRIPLGTATDPRAALTYTFGADSKPIILAGAAETLCLNFNGGAIPAGASIDFTVEYTEI